MIKRGLKWLSIGLGSLLLVLALTIVGLLFTNPGLNLILWGTQKALPELQVAETEGALFPRFTLHELQFDYPDLKLNVDARSVTLAVTPNCFFEPSVCIDELAVDGLRVQLPELPASEPSAEPEPGPEKVTTPLPVRLARLNLSDIELQLLGHQIQWQQLSSGLTFQGARLRLTPTLWQDIVVTLAASDGQTEPDPNGLVQAAATDSDPVAESDSSASAPVSPAQSLAQAEPPLSAAEPASNPASPQQALDELERIVLPEISLPLDIELVDFTMQRFRLEQPTPVVVDHLGIQGVIVGSRVEMKQLQLSMPQGDAELHGRVNLSGDYPLALDLAATVKDPIAAGQQLSLYANGSVADLDLKAKLTGPVEAEMAGQLQPLDADIPHKFGLVRVKGQWPLTGEPDYQFALAELTSSGSLQGYQLTLDGEAKGKQIPELAVTLAGEGDLNQIELQKFDLRTLGGQVQGQLMANWQAPINWSADLSLDKIQPGLQWPEAEGVISGALSTTGALTKQGGWQVDLPKLDINGVIRDYPLTVSGQLSAADKNGDGNIQARTPMLTLAHGPNRVTAKGEVDQQWRMNVTVDVADLAKSVPDVGGNVSGQVDLSGKMREPKIALGLNVANLTWQDQLAIDQISMRGQVQPLPDINADIKLAVRQVRYQQQIVQRVNLSLTGNQQQHDLALDVRSEYGSTSLALQGGLQLEPVLGWQGALQRMNLFSEQGNWRLEQPTELKFDGSKQALALQAHCWLQQSSRLCLDKDAELGQSGEAQLSLSDFNFQQVAMYIPNETKLTGSANATVQAKWDAKAPPQVKVQLTLPEGNVVQQLEQPLQIGWQSLTVNADLADNRLSADWALDIRDNGAISGEITIPDVLQQQKQLQGRLALAAINLDFLQSQMGEYSRVGADINADLAFAGPMLHPQVNGQLAIDQMMLSGEITPIDIQSGHMQLDFSGYQGVVSADIRTPDGVLKVAGDADWQDLAAWHANTRVYAERLRVDMPPMVKMVVVPDMTIAMKPNFAQITGDIGLPWGRIVVEELPTSAVSVSKDQVLLDKSLQPVDQDSAIPFLVETDVNISIGDDFKLSAFGLEGGLQGKLNVTRKNKAPFITGEVNIVDGSYRSFGQDLLITNGKILMNGPADQPYVAITAIRNPDNTRDDVTAGVKVTGPADAPEITIFSEPAMPQANALSYLLRGQDIDGEAGGSAVTTALIGLSLAKSGQVVGQIGEAFGVKDLQLDTAGSGDESKVTVSGYVLPGLQVKYGVGIFESVGEFTVRYRLLQNLYLEGVSGLNNAVDLLYQFEID
ncbi:autotransporter assembly complex protein TamB [Vibrio sp.]|uniref:autotransporter assembly complex protein TamB n=1 Tax=Vibrio sp. TaxID=678 RepID=UPI003D11B176